MIKSGLYRITNGTSTHAQTHARTHFVTVHPRLNANTQQKYKNSHNMGVRGLDTFAHKVIAMRMDTSAHERGVVSLDTLHKMS